MSFAATPLDTIADAVLTARSAFDAGATRSRDRRVALLRRLRDLLVSHEERLLAALAADLGKPRFEAWVTEVGFATSEIDGTLANLANWMAPQRVRTPLALKPGRSRIVSEPLGVVCIIGPWNYPLQLQLLAAVGAIAAGNAVVLKPSELAPASADALAAVVTELGEPAVQIVQGGVAETTELLRHRFDHIVYTGNSRVARIVMRAAAEHLTPVTLELGGKSPAIVSRHANLDVAARRIAWGKFVNAGQTCIAPDYVLVERPVHDAFVAALGRHITAFYGTEPESSPDYARIVNDVHFHRIEKLLHDGTVAVGGGSDPDTRYIAPTVLTGITAGDPVMQEEIFGPVLPVVAVESLDEAVRLVNAGDKPLALYTFSERAADNERVLTGTSSGGACVNATLLHVSNPHLPFGGVGESGMGAYHGKSGFDRLSHQRPVLERSTRLDPALAYPPYRPRKEALVRRGFAMGDPRDTLARLRGALRRR
ncbi:MAG: aldehyde dehydrogenase family protein [Acidimicrobiales bacterium]